MANDHFEQKDQMGSLFRNNHKLNDNQPDFVGKCMVNGKLMRIGAWTRVIQGGTYQGERFLSLKFTEPWDSQKQRAWKPPKPPEEEMF